MIPGRGPSGVMVVRLELESECDGLFSHVRRKAQRGFVEALYTISACNLLGGNLEVFFRPGCPWGYLDPNCDSRAGALGCDGCEVGIGISM